MNLIKTINLVAGFGMFFCILYFAFIYPFVMNGSIIRRIEKKIGVPLHFCLPVYDFQMGGYYLRGYEIANYIVAEYFGLSRYLNPLYALRQIKYDVSTASKYEIVWSFITVFFELIALVSTIIAIVSSLFLRF